MQETQNNQNKIPKIIHTIWFGNNQKNEVILNCEKSIKRVLQNDISRYELKYWSEENFDINDSAFTKKMYTDKRWAFVSDYARLKILYKEGGIYLDSDMFVLKSFNDFIESGFSLVLGKEDGIHISAGMIACTPKNIFIKKCLDFYDTNTDDMITIPRVLTNIFEEYKKDNNIKTDELEKNNIKVFEPNYFYPFDANNIKNFKFDFAKNTSTAPSESYAVHMWNYSWGHPIVKLVKKMGIHKILIKILDILKIKSLLKKLLKSA